MNRLNGTEVMCSSDDNDNHRIIKLDQFDLFASLMVCIYMYVYVWTSVNVSGKRKGGKKYFIY